MTEHGGRQTEAADTPNGNPKPADTTGGNLKPANPPSGSPKPASITDGNQPAPDESAQQRPGRRVLLWILGLGGVFVTALVAGLADRLLDAITADPPPSSPAVTATVTAGPGATNSVVTDTIITDVRLVRPFDGSDQLLAPYTEVRRSASARCISSQESSDPDALRCFTDDSQVLDPCWKGTELAACLRSPWDSDAWIISRIDDQRTVRPKLGDHPWALEIRNPFDKTELLRCGAASSTSGTIAGMPIGWLCSPADATAFTHRGDLVGMPRVSDYRPWTIFFAPKGSSDVRAAPIVTLWW